jgi:hypothetical protein
VHRIAGDEIRSEGGRDCGGRMIGIAWKRMLGRWAIRDVVGGKSERGKRRSWKWLMKKGDAAVGQRRRICCVPQGDNRRRKHRCQMWTADHLVAVENWLISRERNAVADGYDHVGKRGNEP